MSTFFVTWNMLFEDTDVADVRSAAEDALKIHRDPSSIATFFVVEDEYGKRWNVDLHEDTVEEAQAPAIDWRERFMALYTAVAACEAPAGTQVDDVLAEFQPTFEEKPVDRLSTPGKTYDHAARPDDDAEPGDRCRSCGEDITWVGPHHTDWLHVDDKENR